MLDLHVSKPFCGCWYETEIYELIQYFKKYIGDWSSLEPMK